MRAFSIAAFALVLGALAAGTVLARTTARVTATIVNSGSTNAAPFSVSVRSDGHVQAGRGPQASIGKRLTAQFFGALRAAQKSASTEAGGCMKSASFGSVMRVHSGSWSSVDLNCPVTGANASLKTATDAIVAALKLDVPQRRTITLPGNEPRRVPDAPIATPNPSATQR